ncbi:MAG: FhaA domain-containing protein [Chloroflexota bacterium]
MAILADLERLLERVFERSSARLFRTHVQAVQLERRVERAMEHARLANGGRTTVPSRYRVRLAPPDLAAAAQQEGSAEALAGRLADAALAFARAHGYHLRGRPTVSLLADPSVVPGEIGVDAVLDGAPTPTAPGAAHAHASPAAHAAPVAPVARVAPAAPAPAPAASPAPAAGTPTPAEPHALAEDDRQGIRGDGTRTLVFRRPAPQAARATLRACAPDGSERTIEVDGAQLTIGRAQDNGLVLTDSRVSRHHARLASRHGALVYSDLGSTNGSRVNGVRVDEIVLGSGDRIQLGDTVLVVETLPG